MRTRFTLFLIALSSTLFSQNRQVKPGRVLSNIIQYQDAIKQTPEAWIKQQLSSVMEQTHQLQLLKEEKDALGFTHTRYQQLYMGYPVEGSMYIIHQNTDGIYLCNGDIFSIKPTSTHIVITSSDGLIKAKNAIQAQKYLWEEGNTLPEHYAKYAQAPVGELVWVAKNGDMKALNFRLCYKYDMYAIQPLSRHWVYIDVETGELIWKQNGLCDITVTGTAMTKYSGQRSFQTDSVAPGSYRLRDNSRGSGVFTYDKNNSTSTTGAVDFTDADNYWNNINAQQDEVATDAHWGAQKVYDYYWNSYGRNSLDGAGLALNSYVHHGTNYLNAFWDGSAMHYGDGNATADPLTAMDIVAHELTHGVTTFSAGLVYANESGALNESFSDIFGNTLEFIEKPTTADWKLGEEIYANTSAFRNMANPNQFNDPDTYLGTHWYTGTADNGGVHTNSGVQNFWYYLLVNGQSGTNDNGDPYTVQGLGLTQAGAIAYRNLTTYLTPNSEYADARFFAIQAAGDLYGNCSNQVIQTTNAWYAVGVGGVYDTTLVAAFTATPVSSCNIPANVQFTCTGTNVQSALWYFGDGGSSTGLNPNHTYNTAGQYTVKLVVTGCSNNVDSVTVANYISLDSTSVFCDTTYFGNTGTLTKIDCEGVIVDNGGAYGNYANNVTTNVRIASPANVSHYKIKFYNFKTEANYDFVKLYDGTNTSATLMGNWSGTNLPNSGNFINTSDTVFYLRMTSDQALNDEGIIATYECVYLQPTANFTTNDTVTCTGVVAFNNTSLFGTTYLWNFGDGQTSTVANPSHTYALPGVYTVTLTVYNGNLSHTLVKNAYVNFNPSLSMCNLTIMPITGSAIVTDCFGMITDNGGLNNNYSNNVNSTVLLSNATANFYKVKFVSFQTESTNDTLTIYDGPNNLSPVIGQFSGNTLPNGGNYINSTSSNLYISFKSNASVNQPGFKMEYECGYLPTTASFYSVDTVSCDSSIQFTNTSQNAFTYSWNFGDGGTSTAANPIHTYAAPGYYTITLIACNSLYCDTTVINNYIFINPNNPACNTYLQPTVGVQNITGICNGILYDNGGGSANYSANINNSQTVITGQANQQIKLNFLSLDMSSTDYIRIYDGANNTGNLLAEISTLTGSGLPNGGLNIWSTTDKILIEFYSDASLEQGGFAVQWTCAIRNDSINFALLDIDTIDYCSNQFEFNQSGIIPPNISQSVLYTGDGTNYPITNSVNHIYALNGNYKPILVLQNQNSKYYEYGSLNTNQVFANANIPSTAWVGLPVVFSDISVNGGQANWYINGNQVGTGVSYSHTFTASGAFTIMLIASNGVCTDTFAQVVNVSNSVGLINKEEIALSVYPNPFSTELGLNLNVKEATVVLVHLLDAAGRTIVTTNQKVLNGRIVIPTATLAKGVYTLVLELEGNKIVRKVVKQ